MGESRHGWRAARKAVHVLLAASLLLVVNSAAAHEFVLKDSRGQMQRLSDYRGKWVLVNFWAPWCPPCLEEIPDLILLHNAHKDVDLTVISIALDYASSKEVMDFAAQHGISYPVVLGSHKMAAQIGEVGGLPTTYLFDPTGKPAAHQEGAITRESVEEYIHAGGKNNPSAKLR